MTNLSRNKYGFSAVGLLAIILAAGLIGLAYWRVQNRTDSAQTTTNKQAKKVQTGILRAGKLSIDKSKLPAGWQAAPTTYPADSADYQVLSFRYGINLNNYTSLDNPNRNNPALCYISIHQIQRTSGDMRTADDYIKSDIDRVRSTATSDLEVSFAPVSRLSVNAPEGRKAVPAISYTAKYQDQGLQTRYNLAAFLVADTYTGEAAYNCNSSDAADTAAGIISKALQFN